jgi:hypothetical protein
MLYSAQLFLICSLLVTKHAFKQRDFTRDSGLDFVFRFTKASLLDLHYGSNEYAVSVRTLILIRLGAKFTVLLLYSFFHFLLYIS